MGVIKTLTEEQSLSILDKLFDQYADISDEDIIDDPADCRFKDAAATFEREARAAEEMVLRQPQQKAGGFFVDVSISCFDACCLFRAYHGQRNDSRAWVHNLRAILSNMLNQAGFGSVLPPLMNVYELAKKSNAPVEVISPTEKHEGGHLF